MATEQATGIRAVIEAIGRDSLATQDTATVAAALRTLYPGEARRAVWAAIDEMGADEAWSQDREPYTWLAEVAEQF